MIHPVPIALATGIVTLLFASGVAWIGRYRSLPTIFTGPNMCKKESRGCKILFRTQRASIFGIPNSALGFMFAIFVSIAVFVFGWIWIPFLAATLALGFSFVLAAYLIRHRLECTICWIGHFSNFLIWISLCFLL